VTDCGARWNPRRSLSTRPTSLRTTTDAAFNRAQLANARWPCPA
jgi:hypothetical protein